MEYPEASSRRCGGPGAFAITVNGHASEVHARRFGERQRILRPAMNAVGDRPPGIDGVRPEMAETAVVLSEAGRRLPDMRNVG